MLASGPLGLSPPGTRGVARASGSALPLRESSLARRPRFEKKTSLRLPDCRCGAEKKLHEAFSRRLERNDTGHLNARSLRDASHRTRARRTACGSPNIDPPSGFLTMSSPDEAGLARPESRRAPQHGPPDQVLRGVALQRLAGYVSGASRVPRNGTADARLSRAPTEPGARGCSPSPRTTTTSTPKKRSTCEDVLARTRRSRPRRGSETTHETTHDSRRECFFFF